MKIFLVSFLTVIFLISIISGMLFFYYPQISTPKENNKKYHGKVVIGYVTWPGYLGLYVARDKGYFKAAGVDVELRHYDDILVATKDYADGKIQGRLNVPLATVGGIKGADSDLPQKIVLATDYSNGADGIISRPGITRVEQLRGKKVAYQVGTVEETLTEYALKQHGLKLTDIISINLDPAAAAQALAEGKVDAATTYEPFLTATTKEINGNILYTSADAPGLITDILTFRSDFASRYPATINAIADAYFQGVAFWEKHPQEAQELLARELGVTPDDVAMQLKDIKILNKRENQKLFTFSSGASSLFSHLEQREKISPDKKINNDYPVNSQLIKNISL